VVWNQRSVGCAVLPAGRAGAHILLLDNHDDFGPRKRNEFQLGGHTQLLNGGTLLIESPKPYGPVADGSFVSSESMSRRLPRRRRIRIL